MEKNKASLFDVDRSHYVRLMAQNLPLLRASLGLSQSELAQIIGTTRQTISAVESGARELSWSNFISLLHIFTQNQKAGQLLSTLQIYTPELAAMFQVSDLNALQQDADGEGRCAK